MTPDAYTFLRMVNCTNLPLQSSSWGSYQMESWFATPPILPPPRTVCTDLPLLQFQRGVGDEDDAGKLQLSLAGTLHEDDIVYVYGGSRPGTTHYLRLDLSPCSPGGNTGPFVVGVSGTDWNATTATTVSWYATSPAQSVFLSLNPPPAPLPPDNTALVQSLVITDLGQLYDASDAAALNEAIAAKSLQPDQVQSLWTKVTAYCG